jgi:hypothetical protein
MKLKYQIYLKELITQKISTLQNEIALRITAFIWNIFFFFYIYI